MNGYAYEINTVINKVIRHNYFQLLIIFLELCQKNFSSDYEVVTT